MTLDLDEIERIAASNPGGGLLVSNTIPALVAEVKRLREQLGDCESVHDAKITYHNPALQALQHEYERMRGDLRSRVFQLEGALERAIGDIEEWAAYADAYFREKWDLAGCLAWHREVLAGAKAERPGT